MLTTRNGLRSLNKTILLQSSNNYALNQQRGFVTKFVYKWAKGLMPPISKTENIALGCGTIGFDRDIFEGTPSLKKLVDTYKPKLTNEEQSFLDNEVHTLCGMLDDHEVVSKKDFSLEAWDYMRSKKFFGMKIPKEWGGLGFSTQAVSAVLCKLATKCTDANATVAVPNSLGPGELLARYGTPEQKEYFLPRLADGTLIPCFGLTGPHSGSDATSLIGSECIVEERDGELGVVASFKKRYITLAPVAGVVGIGLNLKDPNGLLKGIGEEGFSVALLERDHAGLRMGPRHIPLNAAFMNGTVEGENVWVPMKSILGGQRHCGYGWHMFVECLAEGRGVSLPAGSIGGIQEAMADATSNALIIVAGGDLMNAIVDNHEAPMVISSIMKQNCTERGRRIVEKGMDIAAGSAICRGSRNYLANGYTSLPIAITVEGANVMTRSFQIIGQGLTRCHPHMLDLIHSLMENDPAKEKETLEKFSTGFKEVVGHGFRNYFQSVTRGINSSISTTFRSKTDYKDGDKLLKYHEDQLLRLSANFALTADLCFTLGGRLKFEELLMGRMADAIGAIFLGYATLHHYTRRRGIAGLETATEHAMLRLEAEAQHALHEASNNFPGHPVISKIASTVMKTGCYPLGNITRPYSQPSDTLTKELSKLVTTPSELRSLFQENIYVASDGTMDQVTELIHALPICVEADKVAQKIRKEKRSPTSDEQNVLAQAEAIRDSLIQVDVFEHATPEEAQDGYVRPALQGTAHRLQDSKYKCFDDFYNDQDVNNVAAKA